MSERETPKPEEKVKIVIKYIAGEGAFRLSRTVCPVEKTKEVSLSLNRFIALSVASGYFRMVRNRYQPCFP